MIRTNHRNSTFFPFSNEVAECDIRRIALRISTMPATVVNFRTAFRNKTA